MTGGIFAPGRISFGYSTACIIAYMIAYMTTYITTYITTYTIGGNFAPVVTAFAYINGSNFVPDKL